MNCRSEAKIQKEIRRRAFERADFLQQKKQRLQKTQHTLDALQEVTGLARPQLESIADEIKLSLQVTKDGAFSIKYQILMTCGVFGLIIILCGFAYII